MVADAREAIEALGAALGDYSVSDEYRSRTAELAKEWDDIVSAAYRVDDDGGALNQNQVIGLANTLSDPRDVVVCAAGSMPGDLHKLWRTRDPQGLPRRIRLLLHGIRGGRRHRRQDGRAPTATCSSWSATART